VQESAREPRHTNPLQETHAASKNALATAVAHTDPAAFKTTDHCGPAGMARAVRGPLPHGQRVPACI
jgi:hypothetical protein